MIELRNRVVFALLAVGVVAASMLVAHSSAEPGSTGAGGPAVAHHAGAVIVDPGDVPVPSPRIFNTGVEGYEPMLGIGADGALNVLSREGGYVLRSVDGGITWTDIAPKLGPIRPHEISLDPYLYLDERTGRIFKNDLLEQCQLTSWSDDEGLRWETSSGSCDQADHQTIFAGPPTVSVLSGYPNVVYDCAINGGAFVDFSTVTSCDKSLDGGRTFVTTGGIPFSTAEAPRDGIGTYAIPGLCDGATGHGYVGPDGTVYLPRGWCGQPWLAISRDEGFTWTRIQVSSNGMQRGSNGSPAHDASVVVDADGNIYYLWVAEDRLPYVAISRDRGATFGTPMMIAPPGIDEAALPAMAIGASGKIAMTYMGTTNSPGPPYPSAATCQPVSGCGRTPNYLAVKWNNYVTVTTDALADDPLFFTASMNDPTDPLVKGECGPARCQAEIDFIDVQVAPDGTAWSIFVDACPKVGPCTEYGTQYVGRFVGGPSLR